MPVTFQMRKLKLICKQKPFVLKLWTKGFRDFTDQVAPRAYLTIRILRISGPLLIFT